MAKDVTFLLQFINLALCGGWTYYDILNDSIPFEPIIVFISVAVGLVLARKKKEPAKKTSRTPKGQPKILGTNDRKTDPKEMVGRKGLLKELRTTMQKHGKVALINGMGGIGKTTLAEAYVYQYGRKYDHILWVEQTGEQLEDDFIADRTLLDHLGLSALDEDKKELFRQLTQKLKSVEGANNLLVIDNAEQGLERYRDMLPGHPHWHVLATSRYHMDSMHPITLDFLTEEEAIELFNQESDEKLDQVLVRELVEMVEYHTLSITLLAKTARHYDSDLTRLKTVFTSDLQTKVYLQHAKDQVEQVKAYLTSIFELNNLTDNHIWLLQQFVCLPPDYYDFDWLKDWIQPEEQRAERFNQLLSALSDQGWLLSRKLKGQQWKLHRLIREVLLEKHPPEEQDVVPLINSISGLLAIDQTKDNPIDKFQWVPYGKVMVDLFEESVHEKIAVLHNNLALVLKDLGDYEGAKDLLERAMASDEQNFGPNHPITAVRYSNLATVLKDLGDYEGAKDLLERAMASDEQNFGPNHPIMAVRYSNLALVLQDLGDYEGAKDLLERAMASAEQNFGPNHPNTAVSYSNLATVLKDLGDYEGAKDLLERAMASDEQNFGPNHPNTAVRYSNLALVLKALGDYEGAKDLLERAMASDEQYFGPNHPTTAVHYSNLALVLQDLGDYEGAKDLLERAMASAEQYFGPNHPTTAVRYSNLALVLQDLGEHQQALILAEKTLEVFVHTYPEGHPNIQTVKENIAAIKAGSNE